MQEQTKSNVAFYVQVVADTMRASAWAAAAVLFCTVAIGVIYWEQHIEAHFVTAASAMDKATKSATDSVAALHDTLVGTVSSSYPHGDGILYQTTRLVKGANTLILQASETTNIARHTSLDERTELKTLSTNANTLVMDLDTTVAKVGTGVDSLNALVANLNKTTVPALNDGIVSLSSSASMMSDRAGQLMIATEPVLGSATASLDSLNTLLSDPSWHQTLFNVQLATASTSHTLGVIDTTLTNALNPKKKTFWGTVGFGIVKQLIPRPTFTF